MTCSYCGSLDTKTGTTFGKGNENPFMNAMGPVPLPTDNLYKFCALTGVAMVLFSYYTSSHLDYTRILV
jgi:hypothetical protein